MEELLKVDHIKKYYGSKAGLTKAIRDISFAVDAGEFTAIMGSSGSGKTTLLNCIAGIDPVTGGSIQLKGRDITKLKRNELADFRREQLGFIFQEFNLLDTLTAYDNIALALQIQNCPHREIEGRVLDMAEKLGISEVLKKYPYQMSGGQRQRTAAARAMVINPGLILADEPTGALDSGNSKMLLESLADLNRDFKATILMVTHDPVSASYTGRVLFLKDGKIFHELRRGDEERKSFFTHIMDVLSLLGGDTDVI